MDVFEAVLADHRTFFHNAVLQAADELGLATLLPADAETVASAFGTSTHRCAALLRALVSANALSCVAGSYAGQPPPPTSRLPAQGYGALADVIRSNCPLPSPPVVYQEHLLNAGRDAASEISTVFDGHHHVLDAGGGIGVYAAALLAAGHQVTLLDAPDVLELAHDHLGSAEGFTARAADLTENLTADRFDAALLCNVLHLHGADTCETIIANVCAATDGPVVIKDLSPETEPGIWFALNMALYTADGDVWSPEHIERWLRAAGRSTIRHHTLRASPNSLVLIAS